MSEADKKPVTSQSVRETRMIAAMRMALHYLLDCEAKREDYAVNLARDLSEDDRIRLLWLALDTFPPHIAEQAAQAFFEGSGFPGVSLMADCRSEARMWAADANPREIEIYARACFNKMSAGRKAVFLEWAKGGKK